MRHVRPGMQRSNTSPSYAAGRLPLGASTDRNAGQHWRRMEFGRRRSVCPSVACKAGCMRRGFDVRRKLLRSNQLIGHQQPSANISSRSLVVSCWPYLGGPMSGARRACELGPLQMAPNTTDQRRVKTPGPGPPTRGGGRNQCISFLSNDTPAPGVDLGDVLCTGIPENLLKYRSCCFPHPVQTQRQQLTIPGNQMTILGIPEISLRLVVDSGVR